MERQYEPQRGKGFVDPRAAQKQKEHELLRAALQGGALSGGGGGSGSAGTLFALMQADPSIAARLFRANAQNPQGPTNPLGFQQTNRIAASGSPTPTQEMQQLQLEAMKKQLSAPGPSQGAASGATTMRDIFAPQPQGGGQFANDMLRPPQRDPLLERQEKERLQLELERLRELLRSEEDARRQSETAQTSARDTEKMNRHLASSANARIDRILRSLFG